MSIFTSETAKDKNGSNPFYGGELLMNNNNPKKEETKNELKKLIDFANKFHRVDECGKIEN